MRNTTCFTAPRSEPAAGMDAAALAMSGLARRSLDFDAPRATAAPRPPAKTCLRLTRGSFMGRIVPRMASRCHGASRWLHRGCRTDPADVEPLIAARARADVGGSSHRLVTGSLRSAGAKRPVAQKLSATWIRVDPVGARLRHIGDGNTGRCHRFVRSRPSSGLSERCAKGKMGSPMGPHLSVGGQPE
jgi:hypothetical protein